MAGIYERADRPEVYKEHMFIEVAGKIRDVILAEYPGGVTHEAFGGLCQRAEEIMNQQLDKERRAWQRMENLKMLSTLYPDSNTDRN